MHQPLDARFDSLDMWRGVACLMVVIFHLSGYMQPPSVGWQRVAARIVSALWLGVPMFFVISGYCIAATSDSSRRRLHTVRRYFARRARRIFPPYWVFIAIAVVAIYATRGIWAATMGTPLPVTDPTTLTWQQWVGTLTLTEPIRGHFGGDPFRMFMGHAWTLSYEEQFYALCGLVLWLAPRRFFAGMSAITAITCLIVPFSFKHVGWNLWGFFFDGHWLLFAAGILLYYRSNYAQARARWLFGAGLVGFTCGVAILYAAVLHRRQWVGESSVSLAFELLSGFVFACVLLATRRWDQQICSSPPLAPIRLCGRICYSLYLTHAPLCTVFAAVMAKNGLDGFWPTMTITIPVGTIGSVAVGWIFHRAVERHFLNPSSLRAPRPELGVGVATDQALA